MEVDEDEPEKEEDELEDVDDGNDDGGDEKKVRITTMQQYTNFALPRKIFKSSYVASDKPKNINKLLLKEKNKRLVEEKKDVVKSFKKEIFDLEFREQTKEMDVKEGDYLCPKCKERRVTSMSIQLRSADEPMDIVFKCHNKMCSFEGKNFIKQKKI